jgi:hypothetical protein
LFYFFPERDSICWRQMIPSCNFTILWNFRHWIWNKKKFKKVKCKFSMVDASTAPSPVPFALERICIHMLDNWPHCNLHRQLRPQYCWCGSFHDRITYQLQCDFNSRVWRFWPCSF